MISKIGKRAKEWNTIRKQWFLDHTSDHYNCYICGKWLYPEQTTLDHIIPKSNARNYANRHDYNNLAPCCYTCNSKKGSKHG